MSIPVFYTPDNVVVVGAEWYDILRTNALTATKKRSRLCLHRDPSERLHEMLIVFHRDAVVQPHRHTGKTESYHIVFGELDIVLFDDDGKATKIVELGELNSGKPHVYRLNIPVWHSVLVRSEYAAIHEVTNGPFLPEEAENAPWAPEDPEELRTFLARAVSELTVTSSVPGRKPVRPRRKQSS